MDWELQKIAEKIVKEGVEKNKIYNAYNAALVAIDPKTGEILAMVGSADCYARSLPQKLHAGKNCLFDPQFNVAVGTKNDPAANQALLLSPLFTLRPLKKVMTTNTV